MQAKAIFPLWIPLAAILMCGTCPTLAAADDTYVASVEESMANARKHYATGNFRAAFSDFYWAAIRDHPQAQEMVGLMYLLGPEAFGVDVKRDRGEAAFWMGQAQSRGVDVDEHLRCAITRKVSERTIPIAARALGCLNAATANRQMPAPVSGRAENNRQRIKIH